MRSIAILMFATFVGDMVVGCDAPPGLCGGADEFTCSAGAFCKYGIGMCDTPVAVGVCTPVPEVCTEIFAPVCGCDGVTYSNSCFADAAGVNVDHEGECEDGGM
jgi:hypothetical protein